MLLLYTVLYPVAQSTASVTLPELGMVIVVLLQEHFLRPEQSPPEMLPAVEVNTHCPLVELIDKLNDSPAEYEPPLDLLEPLDVVTESVRDELLVTLFPINVFPTFTP